MTRLEELKKRVEDEGILGISGGIFKDHSNSKASWKANTTVENYCGTMGAAHNLTAEDYANELLNMMDAPTQEYIGECVKCMKMLFEGDEDHVANCTEVLETHELPK